MAAYNPPDQSLLFFYTLPLGARRPFALGGNRGDGGLPGGPAVVSSQIGCGLQNTKTHYIKENGVCNIKT